MSHASPYKWTGKMAFVRGVIRVATSAASSNQSVARHSANTGVAPVCAYPVLTDAMYVKVGTITSSPGPVPRQCNARWPPGPLHTPSACRAPVVHRRALKALDVDAD